MNTKFENGREEHAEVSFYDFKCARCLCNATARNIPNWAVKAMYGDGVWISGHVGRMATSAWNNYMQLNFQRCFDKYHIVGAQDVYRRSESRIKVAYILSMCLLELLFGIYNVNFPLFSNILFLMLASFESGLIECWAKYTPFLSNQRDAQRLWYI